MEHDDEALDSTSSGPAFAAGPASEASTSPAGTPSGVVSDGDIHDDDALADALAAEYSWMATAAIPIVAQPDDDVQPAVEPEAARRAGEESVGVVESPEVVQAAPVWDEPTAAVGPGVPTFVSPFAPPAPPEPSVDPEPEPEQFPWIVAAAAAAAAPPLVQPVESAPFNWSITATGKVAYLDEPSTAETVAAEATAAEATPEEAAPDETAPNPVEPAESSQRMFLPPLLVEPLASPQPTPAAGLPVAPPPYLPVGAKVSEPVEPVELVEIEEPLRYPDADPVDSSVPTATGSISVIDQAYEEELDDDVDDTDRAFADLVGGTGGTAVIAPPTSFLPPSGPISTVRIAEDESVFYNDEPINQRVFSLEKSGLEPTAVELRAGRAARLFWLWFSANSSIISVALGAAVFAAGMSLRQSIVAILAGVALSFIPLGLSTLAGKRSGQPTMVVSRATFGLLGNVVPAALALVSRVFWGAVLLWVLATSVSIILVEANASGGLAENLLVYICLAVGLAVALLVAFAGYPLLARIQLIVTIVSSILIVGLIVLTARFIDIARALTIPDGSWLLTISGVVLVFSFVGLVWAHSGADLARYQRPSSSGASSMLWATFGTTIPAFVLVGYGALLAASDPDIATGLATQPLQTLAGMLPGWYPVPLILATALSLLSGVILSIYSGGLAMQSAGVALPRQWSTIVVGLLLGAAAVILVITLTDGIGAVFRDLATTLAVPTAAWVGIFSSEVMIRNRRFESESLLKRGGVYPDVRWGNLIGLVIITVIGLSLTTASVDWLSWQGFGFTLVGVEVGSDLASTDLGVLVALALGLILPLATAIPAIRRQEATRV